MAIYTDGPRLGPATTLEEIQATNLAHDRKVMADVAMVAAVFVVLIGLVIVMPRAWRRLRAHLAGPGRMLDP